MKNLINDIVTEKENLVLLHCPYPDMPNNYTTFVILNGSAVLANHSHANDSSFFEEGTEIVYRCKDENIYQLIGHPRRICALNKWTDEDHNDTSSSPQCCIQDSSMFIHFRIGKLLINISKLFAVPRKCGAPNIPQGMFVQIDGNNVTTNETYVAGTVAVYKCIDSHDRIVNAGGLEEYSRNCDTLTRSWNGTLPKCGQSSFMKLIDIKFPFKY